MATSGTTQRGNTTTGASVTGGGYQILGNNFSAGGNNVFNIGASPDSLLQTKCLRALFVSNPADDRAKYISFKGQVLAEPFAWIQKSDTYQSWLESASGSNLLWLSGGPGMGKTMLSIFLTQELERHATKSDLVLFYFCEGRDAKRNSPINIFRGLIWAILQQRPTLVKHILPDYDIQQDALFSPDAIEPLWRILVKMIKDPAAGNVYCVIDGLDECAKTSPEYLEHLVRKLEGYFHDEAAIGSSEQPRSFFKLALLSQEQPVYFLRLLSEFRRIQLSNKQKTKQAGVQEPQDHGPEVQEAPQELAGDASAATLSAAPPAIDPAKAAVSELGEHSEASDSLNSYIQARVKQLGASKNYNEDTQASLVQALQNLGDGTFVWTNMALEQLSRSDSTDSEQVAANLPTKTDGMYSFSLLMLPAYITSVAAFILRWVAAAYRPLKLSELSAVLYFMNGQDNGPVLESVREAVGLCNSFLDVDAEGAVKLVHQTAKDFLLSPESQLHRDPKLEVFQTSEAQVHAEIAQQCITYLEKSPFKDRRFHVVDAPDDIFLDTKVVADEEALKEHPFLQYATIYWTKHATSAAPGIIDYTTLMFQSGSEVRHNWYRAAWGAEFMRDGKMAPDLQSNLHIAAWHNLVELIEHLGTKADFPKRLETMNAEGATPVFEAAAHGSVEAINLLLDRGAATKLKFAGNIMAVIAWKGQYRAMQTLLDRGFDVNSDDDTPLASGAAYVLRKLAPTSVGKTIIKSMEKVGGEDDVDELHRHLQNVGNNNTILHIAVMRGHENITKLLLDRGADPLAKTTQGWTLLHFAAYSGSASLIEYVMSVGSKEYSSTAVGYTPLHSAATKGRPAGATYLLDHGHPIDPISLQLETPLHLAANEGRTEMVRLLISRGANVEARTKADRTPLHLAAANGHDETIKVLLEGGAQRYATTKGGKTAAKLAKGGSSSETAILLNSYRSPVSSPGVPSGFETAASPPLPARTHSTPSVIVPEFNKASTDNAARKPSLTPSLPSQTGTQEAVAESANPANSEPTASTPLSQSPSASQDRPAPVKTNSDDATIEKLSKWSKKTSGFARNLVNRVKQS